VVCVHDAPSDFFVWWDDGLLFSIEP